MAVDSANKRSSATNVSSPWRSRLPFPDGTVGAGDRAHTAFMYSGIIDGSAPAPGSGGTDIILCGGARGGHCGRSILRIG